MKNRLICIALLLATLSGCQPPNDGAVPYLSIEMKQDCDGDGAYIGTSNGRYLTDVQIESDDFDFSRWEVGTEVFTPYGWVTASGFAWNQTTMYGHAAGVVTIADWLERGEEVSLRPTALEPDGTLWVGPEETLRIREW